MNCEIILWSLCDKMRRRKLRIDDIRIRIIIWFENIAIKAFVYPSLNSSGILFHLTSSWLNTILVVYISNLKTKFKSSIPYYNEKKWLSYRYYLNFNVILFINSWVSSIELLPTTNVIDLKTTSFWWKRWKFHNFLLRFLWNILNLRRAESCIHLYHCKVSIRFYIMPSRKKVIDIAIENY